jgi:hypothetical protein
LKLEQKRAGNTLEAIGIGKDFLNGTQKAQQLRERTEKMGLHEIKKLLHKRNCL